MRNERLCTRQWGVITKEARKDVRKKVLVSKVSPGEGLGTSTEVNQWTCCRRRKKYNAASVFSKQHLLRTGGWGTRYHLATEESGKDSMKMFQTLDKTWKTDCSIMG